MLEINQRNFWRYWLGGLLLFAILIALAAELKIAEVPGGLAAHQSASSAAAVDRIQMAWQEAGVINIARLVMAIDFLFVTVYSAGAFIGGLLFMRSGPGQLQSPKLRKLGGLIAFAAAVFFVTDNTENAAQTIQLIRMQGDDRLASLAAFLGPIKGVALITSFIGIIAAFLGQRILRS